MMSYRHKHTDVCLSVSTQTTDTISAHISRPACSSLLTRLSYTLTDSLYLSLKPVFVNRR